MSDFVMIDGSHVAGGAFFLGLILYFWWRSKVRRDDIEFQQRMNGNSAGEQAGSDSYDLRTKIRGSKSWIS